MYLNWDYKYSDIKFYQLYWTTFSWQQITVQFFNQANLRIKIKGNYGNGLLYLFSDHFYAIHIYLFTFFMSVQGLTTPIQITTHCISQNCCLQQSQFIRQEIQIILLTMDSSRDQPLVGNVGYPVVTADEYQASIDHQSIDSAIAQGVPLQAVNQGQSIQNQGYQNQGYQNQGYQNQGYQNQNGGSGNQGYMPGQGARMPPGPMQGQAAININFPTYLGSAHPQYSLIMENCLRPCPSCSFVGGDMVTMEPGCSAIAWSICLYCFTGILCFWIPLVSSGCKDIHVRCSRCKHIKFVVQKSCC